MDLEATSHAKTSNLKKDISTTKRVKILRLWNCTLAVHISNYLSICPLMGGMYIVHIPIVRSY